jgi:hypothetical protein
MEKINQSVALLQQLKCIEGVIPTTKRDGSAIVQFFFTNIHEFDFKGTLSCFDLKKIHSIKIHPNLDMGIIYLNN